MKKIILTILVSFLSLSAFAERFVMVTHGEGKDPFWPVVQKGGEDAARHVGADFEYIFYYLNYLAINNFNKLIVQELNS